MKYPSMCATVLTLALVVCAVVGRQTLAGGAPEFVFGTFDDPADLAKWEAGDAGARELTVGPRVPTDINNMLKFVVKSGQYPGIAIYPPRIPNDWSPFEVLSFVVWSASDTGIAVRVDDEKSFNYSTRFNGGAEITRGRTLVQINIPQIARSIDVKRVKALIVFVGDPPPGMTLWFDDFRLGAEQTAQVDFIPYKDRYDLVSSLDVVSPHLPLGRNLAGGPVRAFMLTSVRYGREVVEMMQRMDLTVSQLTWDREWGANTWGFGDFYGRRGHGADCALMQKYLDSSMQGPEAFEVMAMYTPLGWNRFTESSRAKIVERVRDRGEGLVLVMPFPGTRGTTWPEDLRGLSALVDSDSDWQRDDASVKWANNGRIEGRAWRAVGTHPITDGVPLDALPFQHMEVQEYSLADGAKAIVALDSGQPVIAVRQVGKGRVVTIATRALSLTPHVSPPEDYPHEIPHRFWEAWYSLMDRCLAWAAGREFGRAGEPAVLEVSGADVEPSFTARQWKNARGEVTDWELAFAPAGRDVARFDVSAPEIVAPGAPIPVSFIPPAGVGEAVWSATLSERIGTRWRTIERLGLDVPGGAQVRCELPSARVRRYAAYVRVVAERAGRVVAEGKAEVFVPPPNTWDDYEVHTWLESGLPFLQQFEEARMREFGLTANTSGPGDIASHKRMLRAGIRLHGCGFTNGLHAQGIGDHERAYAASKDRKHLVRTPSYADAAFVESERKAARENAAKIAPYQPLSMILSDETSLTSYTKDFDYDFHPDNVKLFRAAMRAKFGSVAALNRALGTSIASFDAIEPPTSDEARASGSWSVWNEWRTHNDDLWTGAFRMYGEAMREAYRASRTSVSGSQESAVFNGIDWAKLAPQLQAISGYGGRFQELQRLSFFPGDQKVTPWGGYGRSGRSVDHQLWDSLTTGGDGMGLFWWYSLRNADLTLSASGRDYQRVIAEFGRGIARQMMMSTRAFSPVAVLWSPISQRAAWATGAFEAFKKAEADVVNALRGADLDPYFISEDELAAGGLAARGAKVVVLPMTLALGTSDGPGGLPVARELEKLLGAGGAVVVTHDVAFDEFLKPARMPERLARQVVRLDSIGDDVAGALRSRGARAHVTVRTADGRRVPGLSTTVHRIPGAADAHVVTLLRTPIGSREVVGADGVIRSEPDGTSGAEVETCTVDVSRFTDCRFFDVRGARQLTPAGGSLTVPMRAGDGLPIAVLPYDRPRFDASASKDATTLAVRWRLVAPAGAKLARHVVRVDVVDAASGAIDAVFGRNVTCGDDGAGMLSVPLALEDAARTLHVRLTDVLTGAAWSDEDPAAAGKPTAPGPATPGAPVAPAASPARADEAARTAPAGNGTRAAGGQQSPGAAGARQGTSPSAGAMALVGGVAVVAVVGTVVVTTRSSRRRRTGRR